MYYAFNIGCTFAKCYPHAHSTHDLQWTLALLWCISQTTECERYAEVVHAWIVYGNWKIVPIVAHATVLRACTFKYVGMFSQISSLSHLTCSCVRKWFWPGEECCLRRKGPTVLSKVVSSSTEVSPTPTGGYVRAFIRDGSMLWKGDHFTCPCILYYIQPAVYINTHTNTHTHEWERDFLHSNIPACCTRDTRKRCDKHCTASIFSRLTLSQPVHPQEARSDVSMHGWPEPPICYCDKWYGHETYIHSYVCTYVQYTTQTSISIQYCPCVHKWITHSK